jgi:hypothetical protein
MYIENRMGLKKDTFEYFIDIKKAFDCVNGMVPSSVPRCYMYMTMSYAQ